jgi:trigger factor
VLEQALDDAEFEPPDTLVRQEMAYRLRRFEEQLKAAGLTLDQYLQSQSMTDEEIENDLRKQAERNVRAQLLLEEIGRRNELTVSEDELRQEVRYHAEVLRTDPAELEKQLSSGGRLAALAGDIIRRKALDLLVEKAEIKEETGSEHAEEPATEQE